MERSPLQIVYLFQSCLCPNKVACFRDLSFFLCARIYDWCSWFTLKRIYTVWTQRSQCLRSILRSKNQLRLSFLFWIAFPLAGRVLLWAQVRVLPFFYDEVSLVLKYAVFLEKKRFFWKRNAFLLVSALFPNQTVLFWKKSESGSQQKQWANIMFKQIPIPCEKNTFW